MRLAVRPLVVGSFDEFAFLELSAGSDERLTR